MHQRLLLFLFLLLYSISSFSQLKSPAAFLGYPVGSRFTSHYKIVDYFRHAEQQAPDKIKLQQYGETVEGRPLLVAYLSSSANLSNLEDIRKNNLALAGISPGKTAISPKTSSVIVWLSYNVHGNEPSSSEAALLTLYELLQPTNKKVTEWLQNTVVILDPCLNPDGRERYVSWFNSISGKDYNVSVDAREHNEPWPGGRTNHYYYDLNRDWAWQTQKESKHRLQLYNQWLPQIHVDFHEQGINEPYYFAPAAQPYHEVITPWQREFQNIIGRNHSKYFDERGWLYFTKEVFDLLYPSYGDTYPLYNGAIGMTYEQGGGPSGGLAVLTDAGDTLTLHDRTFHHFTTSLSTLEVAAQNRDRLLREFQNFYTEAATKGVGDYKSYIIKSNPVDRERVEALKDLLQKNEIQFGYGRKATLHGYSYHNGKEGSFLVDDNDMVVSALQPIGALVKVLFEPSATLVDSLTYDITAWSLPYAYNLNTYAVKQSFASGTSSLPKQNMAKAEAGTYGYIVKWMGTKSARFISQLQQMGIRLRFSEEPFEAGGESFGRGSVIILRASNQHIENLWPSIQAIANEYHISLYPVATGLVDKGYDFGSTRVRPVKDRNVALLTGESINPNAVGEIWHFFEQEINHPITLINIRDFNATDWKDFDVLILPDGEYPFLASRRPAEQFRSWIEQGGNVIALQGAVAQLAQLDWTINQKRKEDSATEHDPYDALRVYERRERDYIPTITPGSIYKVSLDNTHPLAFGYPDFYYTLKQDANIYEFVRAGGWNVGVLKRTRPVAGFVGSRLINRLQDGMLFGTQEVGRGIITYLADDVLFRSFWEGGRLMFCNAVFFVGQ